MLFQKISVVSQILNCNQNFIRLGRYFAYNKLYSIVIFTLTLWVSITQNIYAFESRELTTYQNMASIKNTLKDSYIIRIDRFPDSAISTFERVKKILGQHYVVKASDPYYIKQDINSMAKYYSQFPDVVSLLLSIKDKNWSLVYSDKNWTTSVEGSRLSIEHAIVSFNTRSASKLKFNNSCNNNPVCIASPADALLHELLHVKSMFLDSNEFIAQGGMNQHRYPVQHEHAILQEEKILYRSMTKLDNTKRPYRNEHQGKAISAQCVICID